MFREGVFPPLLFPWVVFFRRSSSFLFFCGVVACFVLFLKEELTKMSFLTFLIIFFFFSPIVFFFESDGVPICVRVLTPPAMRSHFTSPSSFFSLLLGTYSPVAIPRPPPPPPPPRPCTMQRSFILALRPPPFVLFSRPRFLRPDPRVPLSTRAKPFFVVALLVFR